jgi:inhibitor of cysteine peptidase
MKKNVLLFGTFLLALSLLISCGAKGKVLEKDDNGQQVHFVVGEKFSVALASNPTTGFQWDVVEMDETVLKQSSAEYDADIPKMIGSGGKETFTFEAVGPGETTLTLVYHQPWEKREPSQVFSVQVVVAQKR